MDLVFYKLHCLTEDYILINTISNPELPPELFPHTAAAICRRRTGAGASGALFLTASDTEVTLQLYLPDGGPAPFRGNAVLCASRYLFDSGLVGTDSFSLSIADNSVPVDVIDSANFRIPVGTPVNPNTGSVLLPEPTTDYTLPLMIDGKQHMVSPVSIQDTFLVHITDSRRNSALASFTDAVTPQDKNKYPVQPVFLFIQSREECSVRFLKRRTAGFDFSCACAAGGVAGVMNGLTERELVIQFRRETLFFQWLETDNTVYVTAAPRYVYSGNYEFDESAAGFSS